MTAQQEQYSNERIARMLELSCKYPDIPNNCERCEYYPKEGMRKGCCDFGNDDIVKILRSRPALAPDALDLLDGFYERIKVAHRHDTSNYSEGVLDGIDLAISELRAAQQAKERRNE